MRVFIAYRYNSEYARPVIEYLRDFKQRTGKDIEQVDPDTRDGDTLCQLYDVMEYPAIVAMDDDGRMQNSWQGMPLPLMDEVNYYVSQTV